MRGTTETPTALAYDDSTTPGTLVDHGDGTYTYTFLTDITDSAITCPAPCVDAAGNPLDTSYQPTYTHRVVIYTRSPLPTANGIYDFRPDGNTITVSREIVATAKCNECHNKLSAHGGRVETKFCVTCHNPGSWESATGNTVDFKVFIHKLHRGENLPSVVAGGTYAIGEDDFSDVVFPQEIRNCTKCHDGADPATPQGDNWKTGLSMEACGSCHDRIDFSVSGAGTNTAIPVEERTSHSGGVVSDNSKCIECHVKNGAARSVEENHNNTDGVFLAKAERAKFQVNILEICGTAVDSNTTMCAPPGSVPTVKFSVTDPTGGTHLTYGSTYDLFKDPEFWDVGTGSAVGRMSVDIAWNTSDYNNTAGYAARPGRANQINVFGTTDSAPTMAMPTHQSMAKPRTTATALTL